jgi:hypothetical protein
MNATWKFVLARSIDLLPLGELTDARGRSITLELNKPGSLSFNIPMDDDLGQHIQPYLYSVIAYRKGSTGAIAAWSGYVSTIEEDISNNRMTVNCVGWLQRLEKSIVHKDYNFQAADDAAIIYSLVTRASQPGVANPTTQAGFEWPSGTSTATHFDGASVAWPTGSKPNTPTWIKWGGTLPNEGVGGSTAYLAVTSVTLGSAGRNMNYVKYQNNTLQAIMDLVILENGCDIEIDPLTRAFNVYRKKMRTRDGSNSLQPSVIFGYGWGPENIQQISRQIDGSTVVNSLAVTGGEGAGTVIVPDSTSQGLYGLIEESTSISDQSGINASNTIR